MIKKTILAIAALGMAAGAFGLSTTAASAAHVGVNFSVPGLFTSPPPDRSCWQWSSYRHSWEWTCRRPHPEVAWNNRDRRWVNHD